MITVLKYQRYLGSGRKRAFKMHSQARAFLQPTRANIHQYQFNNPIIYLYDDVTMDYNVILLK